MPRPLHALLWEARRQLSLHNQAMLGELLGSSARTAQRWERGQATMMPQQVHRLAELVYPKHAELAAEIAATTGKSLEELGIVPPPAPPAPSDPRAPLAATGLPPFDPIYLVDTVVCAAAEEMDMMPEAIRPALRAAFRRARLARLTVEDIDTALSPPGTTPGAPGSPG